MKYTTPLRTPLRQVLLLLLLVGTSWSPAMAQRATHGHDHGHSHDEGMEALLNKYDKELHFVENKGQFGPTVLYRADFPLGQAVATREGMLVTAFDPEAVAARAREGMAIEEEMALGLPPRELLWRQRGHGWLLHFRGASPDMKVESMDAHADVRNYFVGGKERHAIGVRAFQEVWYRDVYPATDVRYYPAEDGSLEYDIVCKPGSDPKRIAIELKGIDRVWVNEKGELVMSTSLGEMVHPVPYVYQRINGREAKVAAAYRIEGANVVRFDDENA